MTEDCNLNCRYCYAEESTKLKLMPDEVVAKLIDELAALDEDEVKFIWHGGEPLMASLSFYENVLVQQKKTFKTERRFSNIIQTNGTLLNEENISFLTDKHFGVGVSLDGPPAVQNANRPYFGGLPSFTDVWKGVTLLLEREVDFGVLAVVTQNSLCQVEQIFDFFVQHNIKTFGFLPYLSFTSGSLHPLAVSADEYGLFLEKIFKKWVELDDPNVNISNLYDCLDGLLGRTPYKCEASGGCLRCFFAINQSGDVFPCSRFVGEDAFCYGNILDQTLNTLLNNSKAQKTKEMRQTALTECLECQWFSACNGGCLHYRYEKRGSILDPYYYCDSKKRLFELMKSWLKEKLPMSLPQKEWSQELPGNLLNSSLDV